VISTENNSPNDKIGSEVTSLAVITSVSPNKLNAYRFLKILLSEQIQGNPKDATIVEFPVLNSAISTHIKYRFEDITQRQYDGILLSLSNEEIVREFCDIASDIDYCTLNVNYGTYIFYTTMLPYFKGEDTYENCLNKLRNDLELYLNE
jgi:hypothetical protein